MKILYLFAIAMTFACQNKNSQITSQPMNTENQQTAQNIYDFKVETITGDTLDLATLKGKKVIIVNTASKCGLTPQFEGLEKLHQLHKNKNLVIIGFPSNDFMSQDPGSNEEIAEFCQLNYGVTFPMMAKIVVKGKNQHPLYQYLTQKALNGKDDYDVQWNFQKFLINENGTIDKVIDPKTSPLDEEIIEWINS